MKTKTLNWMLEGPEWLKFAIQKQLFNKEITAQKAVRESEIKSLVRVVKHSDQGFDALFKVVIKHICDAFFPFSFFLMYLSNE